MTAPPDLRTLLHAPALLAALALVPLAHAGPSVALPPVPPGPASASSAATLGTCPAPSAAELGVATDRVRFLLEEPVKAPWRSELGLGGATMAEAVTLVGPEHEAACTALYAVAPFDGGEGRPHLYFRVRDVYLVLPARWNLGESLVIAFEGTVSYDTLHVSTF